MYILLCLCCSLTLSLLLSLMFILKYTYIHTVQPYLIDNVQPLFTCNKWQFHMVTMKKKHIYINNKSMCTYIYIFPYSHQGVRQYQLPWTINHQSLPKDLYSVIISYILIFTLHTTYTQRKPKHSVSFPLSYVKDSFLFSLSSIFYW